MFARMFSPGIQSLEIYLAAKEDGINEMKKKFALQLTAASGLGYISEPSNMTLFIHTGMVVSVCVHKHVREIYVLGTGSKSSQHRH